MLGFRDEFYDLLERLLIASGDLRERLPVQTNLGLEKSIDETGIRHPVGPARRIDAGGPKRPKMTLPLFAVTGRERHRASDGLLRCPEQFSTPPHKTLGALEYLFLPFF